jgi:methionyl-tRNA formyltransferase
MTRAVFFGSPEAAVPTLERLVNVADVARVITQPDRPRGRSADPAPTPVKGRAIELGLEVAAPSSHEELRDEVQGVGSFDVGVVVAYGRILRDNILEAPVRGLLNVHFSLLPRWRGAAPVNRAIMAGDPMSGVTIIEIDHGLDTGPVLNAQAVDIGKTETATELTGRLADLGADLMMRTLPGYLNGDLRPIQQTEEGATYAAKLERSDRPIDTNWSAVDVVNHVRGLAEDPAATLEIDGSIHKIHAVETRELEVKQGEWRRLSGHPVVGVANGAVEIVRIQPPGKKTMSGVDWARGRQSDRGPVG